jgi:hypothetical protein
MGANPFLGPFFDLLGPNWHSLCLLPFKDPKKSPFFSAHPFQWPVKWICLHQNHYVLRYIHKGYINSYDPLSQGQELWTWPLASKSAEVETATHFNQVHSFENKTTAEFPHQQIPQQLQQISSSFRSRQQVRWPLATSFLCGRDHSCMFQQLFIKG